MIFISGKLLELSCVINLSHWPNISERTNFEAGDIFMSLYEITTNVGKLCIFLGPDGKLYKLRASYFRKTPQLWTGK